MKKLQLFYILSFIVTISAKAQDTLQTKKNPFTEARFHYYLKTILFFNEYLDTESGSFNTTQLRFLHPIANKAWNLRVDLPLISTNTSSVNKTGIGDIGVGISYIPYLDHSKGIAFRARIISNSASDPALGTGKWVFAPAVFYGAYIREKKLLWIASLENQMSFAGSNNRNDINTTSFENYFMYIIGKNWIAADVAFRYNATNKGYPNNAFIEFGRKITSNNMGYIHPSFAFGNHKSYNYGIEVGILILF
ncbi:lipid A phosphoethanolamine transferase [Flavobacterium psychroterrae]|uniref:Lipid A phosphoethanolamine transferase n=1 Tax=Flavobacterium psychroterrae TaxID=2133767 RepID=A0ABS5PHA7_9FLAO|nr:lipid A phosphoethanolamine transferase [Flavobacterium psychroterrae]MBS7233672.1 lipid A phosphoethanolamine transferase [Flavobacterium psychroterrae]